MLGYGHYLALRSGVTLAIRRTLANYPSTSAGSFESLYERQHNLASPLLDRMPGTERLCGSIPDIVSY